MAGLPKTYGADNPSKKGEETRMHDSVIAIDLREVAEYARHELAVYFSWFTFFLTLLLGAMGWSLKAALDSTGKVKFPAIFFCILFLFAIQLSFAIAATTMVMNDMRSAEFRVTTLLTLLQANHAESGYTPMNPIPAGYWKALGLARWTLIVNFIFWPIVGLFVLHKWKGNQALAGTAIENPI
jgi:hypothetical protein